MSLHPNRWQRRSTVDAFWDAAISFGISSSKFPPLPPQAIEYEWNGRTSVRVYTEAKLTSNTLATFLHCPLGRNQNLQGEESLETGGPQQPKQGARRVRSIRSVTLA